MVSLFKYVLLNGSVKELADSWGVSPEQALVRLRGLPFLILSNTDVRSGGRGRPSRKLSLDPNWLFWNKVGHRPLGELVTYLHTLHKMKEPFALGVPFTSVLLSPFLHPRIRIYVPPETYSVWVRLFAGGLGRLSVVVELFPESVEVMEVERLPVLKPLFAVVDALREYRRKPNLNVLALADWVVHRSPDMNPALRLAAHYGLDGDLSYLEDHRRRSNMRFLRQQEVREAHRLALEMSRVPAGTTFLELLDREAVTHD